MSTSTASRAKKREQIKKLYELLSKYKQVILVSLLNVSSSQVQDIRKHLSKRAAKLVIGKNTVIKKAISLRMAALDKNHEDYEFFRRFGEPMPQLERLAELVQKKVGLVFTDEPVFELKPLIEGNRVETVARVGVAAPTEVTVPAGPTGLDPAQISFFHALHITTKIQKGQIEILKDVKVCEKGRIVGNSEAALLAKLNIKPFFYGMDVLQVYDDGCVLSKEVVDLTPQDLFLKFSKGVANITAISLQLGIVTEGTVPFMMINAFKNILGLALVTDNKIKELEGLGSGGAAPAGGAKKEAKVVEQVKEEEVVEENVDMGGLFDF